MTPKANKKTAHFAEVKALETNLSDQTCPTKAKIAAALAPFISIAAFMAPCPKVTSELAKSARS